MNGFRTRVDVPELLDTGEGSPEDVRASLRDLERISRYLGGTFAVTRYLYPRLRQHRTAVIADIGTGSAELPAQIARWSTRHGITARMLAIDFSARNLDIARGNAQTQPTIKLIQADANHLPFARSQVDYVISSLFLHHLPPEDVVALLRHSYERARRGIIMSDLERSWMTLASFKLVQPLFARSYITRNDAAASVRRGYTSAELRDLARDAGLTNARVHRPFPFRMTLTADK